MMILIVTYYGKKEKRQQGLRKFQQIYSTTNNK